MTTTQTLAILPRSGVGKGAARAVRREGQVPAIIYGDNKPPMTVSVEDKILQRILAQPGFFTHVLHLDLDGQSHAVLPRDVHYDPVTDRPLHVDFLRVSATARVRVSVPVRFVDHDKSPGLKRGGALNVVHHQIDVLAAPSAIPEFFSVSLAGLNVGEGAHLSSLTLPQGVEVVTTEADMTIATIVAPSALRSDDAAASATAGAAAPASAPAAGGAGAKKS